MTGARKRLTREGLSEKQAVSMRRERRESGEAAYVVRSVLSSHVQMRAGYVLRDHLEREIDHEQRRRECIADAGEAATRRGVRLKEHELLPHLLRDADGVEVRREQRLCTRMGKQLLQRVLRRDRLETSGGERGRAVARCIAVGGQIFSNTGIGYFTYTAYCSTEMTLRSLPYASR